MQLRNMVRVTSFALGTAFAALLGGGRRRWIFRVKAGVSCALASALCIGVPAQAGNWDVIANSPGGRDIISYCQAAADRDKRSNINANGGFVPQVSDEYWNQGFYGEIFGHWETYTIQNLPEAIALRVSIRQKAFWGDAKICALRRRLTQLQNPGMVGGKSNAPMAHSPSTPKPRPVEKLPKARPAKTLPWSPKALSTDGSKLDPKFAAERADMLASCAVPIQQFGAAYTLTNGAANLLVEAGNLNDDQMALSAEVFKNHVLVLEKKIADGGYGARDIAATRAGRCVFLRRIAQLEGSPLISGAVDGTLTPLSIGGAGPPSKGIDPHIIAGNGKSAMHCVSLETTGSGDSNLSAAVTGRRFVNRCDDEVEIVWCNTPECERESGNTWTVQPGRGWPVSSNGEVRWGACHGRDTASAVKFSQGLRFYCNAPAKK